MTGDTRHLWNSNFLVFNETNCTVLRINSHVSEDCTKQFVCRRQLETKDKGQFWESMSKVSLTGKYQRSVWEIKVKVKVSIRYQHRRSVQELKC